MDQSGLHTACGLSSVYSAEIPSWSGRGPLICRSVLVQLPQGMTNAQWFLFCDKLDSSREAKRLPNWSVWFNSIWSNNLILIIDWLPLIWDLDPMIASRTSELAPWLRTSGSQKIVQGKREKTKNNKKYWYMKMFRFRIFYHCHGTTSITLCTDQCRSQFGSPDLCDF